MALRVCGTGDQLLGNRLARLDEPSTTQLYTTWLPLLLSTSLLPWFWQSVDRWQLRAAVLAMGWLFFGQVPDQWPLLGMAGVALCGMGSVWLSLRSVR